MIPRRIHARLTSTFTRQKAYKNYGIKLLIVLVYVAHAQIGEHNKRVDWE